MLWLGGWFGLPSSLRGIPGALAHQRLVVLSAGMGRLEDASRHYRLFTEAFTRPDPEFRHLLDEARAAIRR